MDPDPALLIKIQDAAFSIWDQDSGPGNKIKVTYRSTILRIIIRPTIASIINFVLFQRR